MKSTTHPEHARSVDKGAGRSEGQREEHRALLRVKGLKATPQRLALLAVLARTHRPLALHDIETAPETRGITQSTLYRAVKDCVSAGIVRPVDLRHTHAHYELVTGREQHHLICAACGTVEDFVSKVCTSLTRDALRASKAFADVRDHSIELYGTCKRCEV